MRYSMSIPLAAVLVLGGAAQTLGQVINEDLKLVASDGAEGDEFGYSIAIHNGIVAVGALLDDDNGTSSGSANLFDSSTGEQLAKLLPSDGAADDLFGISIAIDNNIVVVGAIYDDDNGSSSGSAYLFDASTGTQLLKLLPNDGATDEWFGSSVAIDNGIVAVGARHDNDNGSSSGSAYLFDASTGAQLAKILPTDGAAGDEFGFSIAIDKGIVAVGALWDADQGFKSGAAYLFDASSGEQLAKLLPSDGAAEDNFGISIAIDNGVVAVGSFQDDDQGTNSGSAYLFDATNGTEIAKLLPNDGKAGELFGNSISIHQGVVAIGAKADDHLGDFSGSAYLFKASTAKQIAKLLTTDGAAGDQSGVSIAIDNGIAALGALGDDDHGSHSGSAYLFEVGVSQSCLDLLVENLIAGERAIFTLLGGTPGTKGITVFGTQSGQTVSKGGLGYCVTFGIKGVNQERILGGRKQVFDATGTIEFDVVVTAGVAGVRGLFQSAQQGTCPDECMSNLVEMVVG